MNRKSTTLPVLAITALGMASGYATTTLIDEPFTYANGNLVGNGGWTAWSAAGSNPIQVASNAVSMSHSGSSSEDISRDFTAQTTGLISASFTISVSDNTNIGYGITGSLGSDFEYFAGFKTGTNFATADLFSKLDLVAPANNTDAGNFRVGISTTATTAEATTLTGLFFNTTYAVTLTYDFSTGLSSATIGGETITSTTPVMATNLDGFFLRQSTSINNESITLDSLVVTAVPEPSITLLGVLGSLFFLRRRR